MDGARPAIADRFTPDYAVVGEGSTGYSAPGVTDVAIAQNGRRASTLVAEGRAAHTSEPDQGENAIHAASDAIDALRDLGPPETTVLGHDVSGSLVVTETAGGSAWKVVPEQCTVTVDERTALGECVPLADLPEVRREHDQGLLSTAWHDKLFAEAVFGAARGLQAGDPRAVVKPHATDGGG